MHCAHRRALDTMHVALLIVALYHYAVTEFGNFLNVVKPHWYVDGFRVWPNLKKVMTRSVIRSLAVCSDKNIPVPVM